MSWLRWQQAHLRFEVQCWWLILTGRGHKNAPQSLEDAYVREVQLWNERQGGPR
jgi:hypothetical protein